MSTRTKAPTCSVLFEGDRAVGVRIKDADGAVTLEQHLDHVDAVMRIHAVPARVLQHHVVELAAHHLPGLRAFVRLVVPEVEGRRQLAVGVDELHAVLFDEAALLHLLEHVEPLEDPIRFGDERFANVEARELLALEQRHLQSGLGEKGRRGRAGRPATDYNDIVFGA